VTPRRLRALWRALAGLLVSPLPLSLQDKSLSL
jgi:hypothetical protein